MLSTNIRRAARALGALGAKFIRTPRHWAVETTEIEVEVAGLAREFDGFRIVQFSDLHLDNHTVTRTRFDALVAQINALHPDLVAFTGDFITFDIPFEPADLIEPLRALRPRVASAAVTGNHDQAKKAIIEQVMRESGMINLNNAVHTLRQGDARLHLAGVDSLVRHKARLDVVLKALPPDEPTILLAHEPQMIEASAATGRFTLQLSGHTHGGQIRVPLLTALALRGGRRYRGGLYVVGGTRLYVNRGIGAVGLPLRINCPPEVTVITLRTA